MTIKAKLPMAKKRKLTIIAVVLVAIVAVPLAAYGLLFYYVTSTNSFHLGFVSFTTPSQFKGGQQNQVTIIVNYKYGWKYGVRDQFTLTVSGTAASWASFSPSFPYKNGIQTLPQFTVIPPSDGAILMIKVPETAQTGNYSVTVLATNSVGLKSSATFTFTVT
ncbi:MAG: Ig domain-containing protein [Candidatus Bathyarchaeia archaeon]